MDKELNLLEELLMAEQKKQELYPDKMTESERTTVEQRIDSLIKIMKIVNAWVNAMKEEDRKSLAAIAERLLDETASAHIQEDANGVIEITVIDSIERQVSSYSANRELPLMKDMRKHQPHQM